MSDPAPPRPVAFGRVPIGEGHPVAVIAEIGVNHEGDAAICARMIEAAAGAGAHFAKLQIIDAEKNYAPGTASHQIFSRAWLAPEDVAGLFRYAREIGIEIFATTGDPDTLAWVDRLEPAGHKISSGLLTHLPLIAMAARTGRPLMMSAGMAEDADVDAAIAAARGASGVVLLHCTSIYPAPIDQLNLKAIRRLADRYTVPVGYSDHTLGIEVPALAVAAGAVAIEKHFTLDSSREGFDHAISLESKGFADMTASLRRVTAALGQATKRLSDAERWSARINHRYIVAARDLPKGHRVADTDIAFLRLRPDAAHGLEPRNIDQIIGQRLRVPLKRFAAVTADDIEP